MLTKESMWDTMNFLAHNKYVMFTHNFGEKCSAQNQLASYANKTIKRCNELSTLLATVDARLAEFNIAVYDFKLTAGEYIQALDYKCLQE